MNNLVSYCGLTDGRMRASEKDLPVSKKSAFNILCMTTSRELDLMHQYCYKIFCNTPHMHISRDHVVSVQLYHSKTKL